MYQPTRQHVEVRGFGSASTARKAIASARVARPFVQAALVADNSIAEQVTVRVAMEDGLVGGIPVREDQAYYLVRSRKFANRFYVVVLVDGKYVCSSREEKVIDYCITKVLECRDLMMAA